MMTLNLQEPYGGKPLYLNKTSFSSLASRASYFINITLKRIDNDQILMQCTFTKNLVEKHLVFAVDLVILRDDQSQTWLP
jgi:hypothetical protein